MKARLILMLLLLLGTAAWGQIARGSNAANTVQTGNTTFKIEKGKVWLNGKAIPQENLPLSLQKIDPNIYYESTVAGVTEFTFNLGDHYYLIQNGKLSELAEPAGDASLAGYDSKAATEAYYSQLKRESPGLFYGLSREGVLLEQIRTLLFEYSKANKKHRETLKEEMRKVLSQLYDINQRNKELEIAELEEMIKAAKQEVQYRKTHKAEIIDNSLNNLLKE